MIKGLATVAAPSFVDRLTGRRHSKLKTENQHKPQSPSEKGRKPYAPPELREFGPVGALTQAGTGAMGENPMNPKNPMQRL